MTIRAIVAILLLLFALLAWSSTSHAAVVWFSGLETGGAVGTGASLILDGDIYVFGLGTTPNNTTTVHSGSRSLQAGTNGARYGQSLTGLNLSTAYVRGYYRTPSIAAGAQPENQYIFTSLSSGNAEQFTLAIVPASSLLVYTYQAGSNLQTGTHAISINTWYLLEMKLVVHASAGGMELRINGKVEWSDLTHDTSAGGNMDAFAFGAFLAGGTQGTTNLWDDMAVSDSGYLGPGYTLARQGAAGTPTYDAWTKNSCTGGTIDGCWSDTPVDATKNASNATASDAQTMVVHDFATAQSGHGAEVIVEGSGLNACRTIMSAKSGTAAAPLSMRRRLNGTDTDVAKTLTTADAYYNDGIWTTTIAILRDSTKMEIGAVHGAGVATDTVEDMWLVCDFPTVPIRHKVTQ